MNQDFYSYLQKLHSFVESQEKRISSLEKKIQQLHEETIALKKRPPINIERIDYKFDQLKVETLEGTLNIGLNPADLENIEDFTVDNKEINAPIPPKLHMKKAMEIENVMYHYLDHDLPDVLSEVQRNLNVAEDASYLSFIKEDIKKQLPTKIDSYLKQHLATDEQNRHSNEDIINLLKTDILNGIQIFISHLPENVKGMKNE
ncbi:spore germination protein PC [Cytobacillus eiseniae]|uniref:Spore germination protein PC n=1 Tax=Cytobacillus eiseniae TaxID=762947 RepID=A0ABS4RDZ1_9BACI|nr:spore germination protein GerPC [Cytobacillus eiseniae]MBP2241120.1 spore germination protein PC [Cytobacillus eiseniae]